MNTFKKFLVVLFISVMGIGMANAEFRFGIKAGLNVNHLSTNYKNVIDKNNQAGFTAGVMTEFKVPIIGLGFDLSLMYTRMNSDADEDAVEIDNKNFIEIPLNLKYKFGLPVVGNIISPYIFTGPSFGFNLDKHTYEYFKTKTFQAVWNVGLGIELVKHLQIGASYGFGMNNIVKTLKSDIEPIKLHNNYWTITAAYLF